MDTLLGISQINSLSNGVIEDISLQNNTTFVTVSYSNCRNCRRNQTINLVVGQQTLILDESGNVIRVKDLKIGMIINASFSSAVTRSIPPQSTAYIIRIVRRLMSDNIVVGRIVDIDRQNRSFTTISDGNISSVIRFNVPTNALIVDRIGIPLNFSRLVPGMRVRIRHAAFMTASIPPQTTAFEVRVI